MLIAYVRFLVKSKSTQKPSSVILPLPDPDVESLLLGEEPKQDLHSPPEVQEAWEQERQQQMWLLFIYKCENVICKSLYIKDVFFL